MPLYEYECEACGQRFELIRKFSDPPVDVCARCGKGPVRRLLSSPAIQFKGSGWYITDYAQKGKTDSAGKPAGDTKTSEPTPAGDSASSKSDGAGKSSPAPSAAAKD